MGDGQNDLHSQVQALDNSDASSVCSLLNLDRRGGARAKQTRILSLVAGPPSRQRVGWLKFFLHVHSQGAVDDDGIDYETLEEADQKILAEYVENFHLENKWQRAPNCDMLPDLVVEPQDSAQDKFSLPDGYSWPSQMAVLAALGNPDAPSVSSSGSSNIGTEMVGVSEAEIRANILADIGEGRLGVHGEDSAAVVRRTHAFEIDPQVFFVFDHEVGKDKKRTLLCDGQPGNRISRDRMAEFLFENKLTATDIKRIQRRYLVPEEYYASAPCIDDAAAITEMGGKKGKYFKEFERLRVKQEAILSQRQSLFFMLAQASDAFLSLDAAVNNVNAQERPRNQQQRKICSTDCIPLNHSKIVVWFGLIAFVGLSTNLR